jgi:IS30 family transposase
MVYVGRTLNLEKGSVEQLGFYKYILVDKKLAVCSTHTCAIRRNAELGSNAIIHLLQPLIDLLHIITGDNGKEFAGHERIDKDLKIDFFFDCHYSD